jgi:TPR repeat protein
MALPPLPIDLPTVRKLTTEQWKAVLEAPPEDAFRWMHSAAQLGHAGAQALMGQWLLDGRGTARHPQQAFDWFLKAAGQGDDIGANMAGRCLENGWGIAPDLAAAIGWYRKAADKGLDAGLYNLANQLASGAGLPQDHSQALALYTRAAALGHAKSMTKAGRYHDEGLSVPRDAARAAELYRCGAEGGDFRGQYQYARVLAERGEAGLALQWLEKVPLTATAGFLEEVGALLAGSADARFALLGGQMLARAGELRTGVAA